MKARYTLMVMSLLILGILVGRFLIPGQSSHTRGATHAHEPDVSATVWTCSMHPQIQQTSPGDCPICGMDLIPLADDGKSEDRPRTLRMSENAKALAEVETSPVIRQNAKPIIRLNGKLERAETRVQSLTARFPARVEKLYVDAVGLEVAKGQALALVYGPELLSAQNELLAAHRRDPDSRFTQAARQKLLLWDLQPEQIDDLLQADEAQKFFEVRASIDGVVLKKQINEGDYIKTGQALYTIADLSELWLYLDAYETDLPWLRVGQSVNFTVQSLPNSQFESRIEFIDPELDERSRTVPIRVLVKNESAQLKPGMFAQATVQAESDEALLVPATAVLRTGQRAVVYVEVPDQENPTYEGREISLGARSGSHYVVANGLEENESVVTHGAFKIDSALQIKAKPSMMSIASKKAPGAEWKPSFWRPLIKPYLNLQAALAADDLGGSKKALLAMMARIGHSGEAAERIHQMLAADTLNEIRRPHFEALSNSLIEAVAAAPEQIPNALYLMHCPMVYSNREDNGAYWLQADERLINPYFGAMMLRCGEQKEKWGVERGMTDDQEVAK